MTIEATTPGRSAPATEADRGQAVLEPRASEHHTWMQVAACHGDEPGWWWPTRRDYPTRAKALTICDDCPVQRECLSYALAYDERYGIWGGKDDRSRQAMRRSVSQALAALNEFHQAWTDAHQDKR